jgi:hypothetical protein
MQQCVIGRRLCKWGLAAALTVACLAHFSILRAQDLEAVETEGQPLAANANRLAQALEFLGAPLPSEIQAALQQASKASDWRKLQETLDPHALLVVNLNPESRVKVGRGPAEAILQQGAYTPIIVKVINASTVTKQLAISSLQSGRVYTSAREPKIAGDTQRFLEVEMFTSNPMTSHLSGLKVEYALALIYSSEAGKREAVISFDVGQGTQDLGFRAEVPVLFDIRPGIAVKLSVKDHDGKPTVGRFTFKDKANHVYPPQPKRLAPDFFFQPQIYRRDGDTVMLPPGELTMTYGRGTEYRQIEKKITVPSSGTAEIDVQLERWINPMDYGFYSGDHHIHAAGCAHYSKPTMGVLPQDMVLHVKGEGLNVGCVLTWGLGFSYQRTFFDPAPSKVSDPFTLLKYDLEISAFGSQALGHLCLINLKDQVYPGTNGSENNWPTWTTPILRWAKKQGALTGYAHSGSGLEINPTAAARRLMEELDTNKDGKIDADEAKKGLLPEDFAAIDSGHNHAFSEAELVESLTRVSKRLPNYAIPEMNGIGAQEICVTTAQGLCDFIASMNTERIPEWNCWYHLMNCGFPLKTSGETDFPCQSGNRVGEGRTYVQLGKVDHLDFDAWCEGVAKGRSYVSDGYSHALEFTVNGKAPGAEIALEQPGTLEIKAKVAFAAQSFEGRGYGNWGIPDGGTRKIELVVNGLPVASQDVPADYKAHDLTMTAKVERSSWVALRSFPQMHTNPVIVLVEGKPIRASRKSALWCIGTIEQLWRTRGNTIAAGEREEANKTFHAAIETFRKIAAESPE